VRVTGGRRSRRGKGGVRPSASDSDTERKGHRDGDPVRGAGGGVFDEGLRPARGRHEAANGGV